MAFSHQNLWHRSVHCLSLSVFVFMQETNVICNNSLIFPCIFCSRQTELLSQTWVDGLQESVDEDGRIRTLS